MRMEDRDRWRRLEEGLADTLAALVAVEKRTFPRIEFPQRTGTFFFSKGVTAVLRILAVSERHQEY